MKRMWPAVMWLALAFIAGVAQAGDGKASKGAWKALVQPGAKWTLKETSAADGTTPRTITIETYDVRKVGAADVARLRWTLSDGKKKQEIGDSAQGRYTQVAVTPAGLYVLSGEMDDGAVADALKKKPTRPDPPRAQKASKQSHGLSVEIEQGAGGPLVCLGEDRRKAAGECESICIGDVCISPDAGVVKLEGLWAPDSGVFEKQP